MVSDLIMDRFNVNVEGYLGRTFLVALLTLKFANLVVHCFDVAAEIALSCELAFALWALVVSDLIMYSFDVSIKFGGKHEFHFTSITLIWPYIFCTSSATIACFIPLTCSLFDRKEL